MAEAMDPGTATSLERSETGLETQAGGAPHDATTPDPGDFEARLRTEPEFAVQEFKKQQSRASQLAAKIQQAELAIKIAEEMGRGDVSAGSKGLLQEIMSYQQMQRDPNLGPLIQRYLSGQPLDGIGATDSADRDHYAEPEDPIRREIESIRGTLTRHDTQLLRNRLDKELDQFMRGPIGSHLTSEEKAGFLQSLDTQFQTWSRSEEGRTALQNIGTNTMFSLACTHLGQQKLLEIGGRDARARSEQLRTRETDSPPSIRGNAGGPSYKGNIYEIASQALADAKRKYGAA